MGVEIVSETKVGGLGAPTVTLIRVPATHAVMGEREFSSVVISRDGYDALMDELLLHPLSGGTQAEWHRNVEAMRSLDNVPAVGRGTKTEWLFKKYGVTTRVMGIIVRGEAAGVLAKLAGLAG